MAKMQITEETVDKAIELCDEVLDELLSLIRAVDVNFNEISGGWNDEQFKSVKKSVDESIDTLDNSFNEVGRLRIGLEKVKEYVRDYDTPIV